MQKGQPGRPKKDEITGGWRLQDTACPNLGQMRSSACKAVLRKRIVQTEIEFPARGRKREFSAATGGFRDPVRA